MIRTSLAAVQRATFLFSKIAVAAGLALVVGMITSFIAFSSDRRRSARTARRSATPGCCARWSAAAST